MTSASHGLTQAVYLDCDSENRLCFAVYVFLKSSLVTKWKVMFCLPRREWKATEKKICVACKSAVLRLSEW